MPTAMSFTRGRLQRAACRRPNAAPSPGWEEDALGFVRSRKGFAFNFETKSEAVVYADASAKCGKMPEQLMPGGKMLSGRLLEFGAGQGTRCELGRLAVKQQHEVGSDILLLELLDGINGQLQPVAETAGIASGEVPYRPCVL